MSVEQEAECAGAPAPSLGPVVMVAIADLVLSGHVRLNGEDEQHVRRLAKLGRSVPPIIVRRGTMRVIDGWHRVKAAVLNDEVDIAARYFDGSESDQLQLAVRVNSAHGLPLTSADRRAVATHIITIHPEWSDRAVAEVAGITGKTVGALRRRSTEDLPQSNARIGRDGRTRPVDAAEGRRIAGEILTRQPRLSLRKVAARAGIAVSTARDVRDRLRRGDGPLPPKFRASGDAGNVEHPESRDPVPSGLTATGRQHIDKAAVLDVLMSDPALRFTDVGRSLLRWLATRVIDADDYQTLIDSVPPHCVSVIADLADISAEAWRTFAEELNRRAGSAGEGSGQP
ncbi:streptomycin biosynthesis protein [Amycolatopsis sp. NPDC004169]|uniref:streptomycin biosynthesis protein n=1 Tax=Amycolatopsis sp. NPDC004169 TaxID=3154453 RepID=UPI0033B40D85